MALPDLFSRRSRNKRREGADVYQYASLPQNLRVQFIQIVKSAIGPYSDYTSSPPGAAVYEFVVTTLRRDIGVFELAPHHRGDMGVEFGMWFLAENDVERLLDAVELFLRVIDTHVRDEPYAFQRYSETTPDAAIAEVNARFLEACVGFQFESGQINRIDSQVMHSEVVVPALRILADPKYAGAESEYLKAHEAFRHGDNETCLIECGKAFESVLKVIAAERAWPVTANDPAKKLLDAAFAAGFIDKILQAEFTALRSLLESAVPVVRNKLAGHGSGAAPRNVPQHVASFQLHQTGAAILFLAQHHAAS
jgi:hypothetical protein